MQNEFIKIQNAYRLYVVQRHYPSHQINTKLVLLETFDRRDA